MILRFGDILASLDKAIRNSSASYWLPLLSVESVAR